MIESSGGISRSRLRAAVRHLRTGGVIAYPTEAVFGLGCDPDDSTAVRTILDLKHRPVEKGLILIAAEFKQLLPYIDIDDLPNPRRILRTWPGPVTWLIKARSRVPVWLRGAHETIAVRVTAHPVAAGICREFGKALVSTSANPAGALPARSGLKTRLYFGSSNILIINAAVGGEPRPSAIFDSRTLERLR